MIGNISEDIALLIHAVQQVDTKFKQMESVIETKKTEVEALELEASSVYTELCKVRQQLMRAISSAASSAA